MWVGNYFARSKRQTLASTKSNTLEKVKSLTSKSIKFEVLVST